MMQTSEAVSFDTPNKAKEVINMSFDDVDFIISSTMLSFPQLWPDEAPSEEQQSNPTWRRTQALALVEKFIPALVKKFDEAYGTSFHLGTIQRLYSKYNEYKNSLKKNTVVEPSTALPTGSIAADSTTKPTTTT